MDGISEILQRLLDCHALLNGIENRGGQILGCLQLQVEPNRLEIRNKSNLILPPIIISPETDSVPVPITQSLEQHNVHRIPSHARLLQVEHPNQDKHLHCHIVSVRQRYVRVCQGLSCTFRERGCLCDQADYCGGQVFAFARHCAPGFETGKYYGIFWGYVDLVSGRH